MRTQIQVLDARFRSIHERSLATVNAVSPELLFHRPDPHGDTSFAENLVRSAAAVEQTFGGITARLWDNPFEWTLPEELDSHGKIVEYLQNVEGTRQRGFKFFSSDSDLSKCIPAPEELRTIFDVLIETIARAEHFQGRSLAIAQVLAGVAPPRP